MSRYLARLEKLEAAVPKAPVQQTAPRSSLAIDFARIVAKSKADAAFLETATPLERHTFYTAEIKRHEAALVDASKPTDRILVETLNKVKKATIPSFLEDARQELQQAGIDILRDAGFTSHTQPGAQSRLAEILFIA